MGLIKVDTDRMDKFLKQFRNKGMTPTEFLVCTIFQQCTIPVIRYNVTRMYGSPTLFKETLTKMQEAGVIEISRREPDVTRQLKYIKFSEKSTKIFFDGSGNIDTFVNYYRALFPPHYKGDRRGCRVKLVNFLRDYEEFSKEDVLKATGNYIDSFNGRYDYLQQAHYFILKNQVSNLASWCERLSEDDSDPDSSTVERLNRD